MNHHIQPICLFTEWIHLASRLATNTLTKQVASDIAQRYNVDEHQLVDVLSRVTEFEDLLKETVDTTAADFDFFFYPIRQESTTLAQAFATLYNDQENYNKRDFSDITSNQWIHQFTHSLSNLLDEDDLDAFKEKHNIHDLESLIHTITRSSLEEGVKYRMIVAATSPIWCIERLWEMYDQHASTWKEHYEALNSFAQSKLKYWMSQYDSILDLIQEKVNVEGIQADQSLSVVPSVFNFNTLTILNKDQFTLALKEPVLHLGPMIFDLSDAVEKLPQENERLLASLKVLSDKSKFEILKVCQDKSMYGQQIASHLQVTTATASYHLNALVSMGYLTLHVEANKIYYKTKANKVRADLNKVLSIFEKAS